MVTKIARVLPVVGVLLILPIIMGADSCKGMAPSNEAKFLQPSRQGAYCFEDVPIEAVASASQNADFVATAILSTPVEGGFRILKRVSVNRGDQLDLSTTISWAEVSGYRGYHMLVILDLGAFPDTFTQGSIIGHDTFASVFNYQAISARATRTFRICD